MSEGPGGLPFVLKLKEYVHRTARPGVI